MDVQLMRLLKRNKSKILNFLIYSPKGEVLKIKDYVIKKNFELKDLGYVVQNDGKFHKIEENKDMGPVSVSYVKEILWDTLINDPDDFVRRAK